MLISNVFSSVAIRLSRIRWSICFLLHHIVQSMTVQNVDQRHSSVLHWMFPLIQTCWSVILQYVSQDFTPSHNKNTALSFSLSFEIWSSSTLTCQKKCKKAWKIKQDNKMHNYHLITWKLPWLHRPNLNLPLKENNFSKFWNWTRDFWDENVINMCL
jgi:hypothetical protein